MWRAWVSASVRPEEEGSSMHDSPALRLHPVYLACNYLFSYLETAPHRRAIKFKCNRGGTGTCLFCTLFNCPSLFPLNVQKWETFFEWMSLMLVRNADRRIKTSGENSRGNLWSMFFSENIQSWLCQRFLSSCSNILLSSFPKATGIWKSQKRTTKRITRLTRFKIHNRWIHHF